MANNVVWPKLSRISLAPLPDNIQFEVTDEIQQQICKAFMLEADKLIVSGDSSNKVVYNTSMGTASFTITQPMTREDVEKFFAIFDPVTRFNRKLKTAILETLAQAGLHPDNIERIEIALDTQAGLDAAHKLTIALLSDVEYLTQLFLKIYHEEMNK